MARANPNSFCTKWVEQSDAMSDELYQLEDQIAAAKKARAKYLYEHPVERRRLGHLRDMVPVLRDNLPISLFADARNAPK
jgi:hypothetical protein